MEKTPNLPAIETTQRQYAWNELDRVSEEMANRYRKWGIGPGTHVAIWCANEIQWVLTFLALQKNGALTILLNPGCQPAELENLLRYSDAEYLFYGERFKTHNMKEVLDQVDLTKLAKLKRAVAMETHLEIEKILEKASARDESRTRQMRTRERDRESEQPACMLFTSGTTSSPKGVLLSHRNLVNDAIATARAMRWSQKDKTCVMVPFFHCFGLTSCLLSSFEAGNSLYLMKNYRTQTALEAIQNAGCTVLNGVPSMFLSLLYHPDRKRYDLTTLESGIIAGSTISTTEYLEVCRELQIEHLQMSYGQTETSPGVSFSDYTVSWEEKATNAGRFIEQIQVCFWNRDGRQVVVSKDDLEGRHDTVKDEYRGEIGIKGFPVMMGYYQNRKETEAVLQEDGWLHTGDLGFLDENGWLHIEGRIKEIIIRGGENISPQEIEMCIQDMPEVYQVKVVGVPHPILQEEIGALVVKRKGASLSEDMIRDHVSARLAHFKVPRHIAFIDRMPVNSSGKILIGEVKKYMREKVEQFK